MSADQQHQDTRRTLWWEVVPPPAVYVPAVHVSDVYRSHAAYAVPGHGVMYDLRALSTRANEIGLVPEDDYWRTQIRPDTRVDPIWAPLDQVWVENRLGDAAAAAWPATDHSDPAVLLRRLAPGPDQPVPRTPVPARSVPRLSGRRIIQITPSGPRYGLRAIAEPYEAGSEEPEELAHDVVVRVVGPYAYYTWLLCGTTAEEPTTLPLWSLWVE